MTVCECQYGGCTEFATFEVWDSPVNAIPVCTRHAKIVRRGPSGLFSREIQWTPPQQAAPPPEPTGLQKQVRAGEARDEDREQPVMPLPTVQRPVVLRQRSAWADEAAASRAQTPSPAPRVEREEPVMGYWQTVGARIMTSLVVGLVFMGIATACQASGR
jgi:hypothetical protein